MPDLRRLTLGTPHRKIPAPARGTRGRLESMSISSMRWRAASVFITAGGVAAAVLALAVPAGASTGTTEISREQAGYTATGARFQNIDARVFLRQPAQHLGGQLAARPVSLSERRPRRLIHGKALVGIAISLERCECRLTESMTVSCPAPWKNTGALLPPGWGICRWASAITIGNWPTRRPAAGS